MTATIHQLHKPPESLGHYLRLGNTGHIMLANLYAAGRLPIQSAVVDAPQVDLQAELLDTLYRGSVELILDPKIAELATPGGLRTKAKNLPWAPNERPHAPEDFCESRIKITAELIAEFAITEGFTTVLAPTHLLSRTTGDPWFGIDAKLCQALRSALDCNGRKDIHIDYSLTVTYEFYRNPDALNAILGTLNSLPIDNIWIRVSGFSYNQSAAGVKRYIESAFELSSIGKPLIADQIGGLAGLSFMAFGATGGLSHGIACKEQFETNSWRKPQDGRRGGLPKRIYFPGLDTYFTKLQAESLFKGTGAKTLLACNDPTCCQAGVRDTLEAPEAHFIKQRMNQIRDLNQIPELRRADDFLCQRLSDANQTAAIARQLDIGDEDIKKKIVKSSKRLDALEKVLKEVARTTHNFNRSEFPRKRNFDTKSESRTRKNK